MLKCYEIIDAVSAGIRVDYAPNVEAIARTISRGAPSVQQQLVDYAKRCCQPGFDYFNYQLTSSLKTPLLAFKAAGMFSPPKLHTMQPNATALDDLTAFPFFKSTDIAGLKAELPMYIAKV